MRRVGIVEDVDDDGDKIRLGWGTDVGMKKVVWTSESGLNSVCFLHKTKEEAEKDLAEHFQSKIEISEIMVKNLIKTIALLKESKKAVLLGKSAKISPMLAIYNVTEDAETEYSKKQNIKRLKKQYYKALKGLT